jgi:hypothetical protein
MEWEGAFDQSKEKEEKSRSCELGLLLLACWCSTYLFLPPLFFQNQQRTANGPAWYHQTSFIHMLAFFNKMPIWHVCDLQQHKVRFMQKGMFQIQTPNTS